MNGDSIRVKVFRFDPSRDREPYYSDYSVPFEKGMSAMDALDYIYQNLDGGIAYYDHAGCSLGICARCTGRVNGKPGLICQTAVEGDIVLEPVNKDKVIKDLVTRRGG
ncbi:MAG: succinate dehydrogenase [Spirochaetes bacterium]|nr:MAG: succinate dehydrogenase [Spirochaetota bacterium]